VCVEVVLVKIPPPLLPLQLEDEDLENEDEEKLLLRLPLLLLPLASIVVARNAVTVRIAIPHKTAKTYLFVNQLPRFTSSSLVRFCFELHESTT
jgi:hypothetical protein